MGQFVDEALQIDGVLVDVDAAPEAGRHRRVAHGVLDQQVRHRVADGVVAVGMEALEGDRVRAVLAHPLGAHGGQDGLARDAHMQRGELAVFGEAADQPALGDRVVVAVGHVLLAGPEQLHRRAGQLLGDADGLGDEVVEGAAPAEAAAQMDLVHVALADG
jgi:hypothetical protein